MEDYAPYVGVVTSQGLDMGELWRGPQLDQATPVSFRQRKSNEKL